jgi:hypothetical protein
LDVVSQEEGRRAGDGGDGPAREFRVHTIGDTHIVIWLEHGLGRKITARRSRPGAMYSIEVAPGRWRYAKVPRTARIVFRDVRMLSSLVMRMMRDDTLPKV